MIHINFDDGDIIKAQIAINAFDMLHYKGAPEELVGFNLEELHKKIMDLFYKRFPGQKIEDFK